MIILLLKHIVSLVDKWIKQNKMDFLGIRSCVGFGLHADSYRCEKCIWIFTHKVYTYMKEFYFNLGGSAICFFFNRFLIFPNMGQSLQSVMEDEDELLPEKAALQLACRIVGVGLFFTQYS